MKFALPSGRKEVFLKNLTCGLPFYFSQLLGKKDACIIQYLNCIIQTQGMPMTNSPPYHNGYIDAATRLQPAFEQYDLNMAIITIVLALFGLFFNLIIFYAFWGMRKSGSAMIFLNLAAVDVVLTCCAMPFSITTLLIRSEGGSAPHYVFCAVTGSLFETCVLCTLGFVLLASIDRFLGVYYPIYHRKYFSRTNLIRMVSPDNNLIRILSFTYISLEILRDIFLL